MKKLIAFAVFLFTFSLLAHSQGNFIPGSIITNQGDSVAGLIKVQPEIKLKDKFQFKESKKSKVKTYTPEEIKSFRIQKNKYYVSKKINCEGQPKFVFLECLVQGKVDLFFMKNKKEIRYFIQDKDDSLRELLHSVKEVVINGSVFSKDMKEYIGTLNSALKDYPPIYGDIAEARPSNKDLVKLIKKYNDNACKDGVCIVYSKNVKPTTFIGFKAGTSYSNISFYPSLVTDYLSIFDNLTNENFTFTNALSISFLISQKNLFGSNNLSQNLSVGYSNDIYKSKNITIDQKTISVPFYFSYYFPIGDLRPFISYGIDNVFMLKNKFSGYWSNSESAMGSLDWSIKQYQLNGLLGIGLEISKNSWNYFASANYEFGSGINGRGFLESLFLVSSNKRFRIEVGCNFKLGK